MAFGRGELWLLCRNSEKKSKSSQSSIICNDVEREWGKMGEPISKKSRLTQRSWALPHGPSRHSPSGLTSALVLVPSERQRTRVQVGDGGEL